MIAAVPVPVLPSLDVSFLILVSKYLKIVRNEEMLRVSKSDLQTRA